MKHTSIKLLRIFAMAGALAALVACGGGGSSGTAGSNTNTTATLTLPDLQGTVSGTTRVVANKIYNYSATEATGMTGAYTVNWGDGTPSFSLVAASATQDKIWRAAGNYTGSLSRTKADGTVVTANQAIAVVDKPVSMGNKHSCAIMSDNTVSCWGDNTYGQLGNGTQVSSNSPLLVNGLNNIVSLAAYGFGTCAAKTDGTVWCWGQAPLNMSRGAIVTAPLQVPALSNVIALAGSEYGTYSHMCALQRTGTVKCWGSNARGELGDGTALVHTGPGVNSTTPVSVTDLLDAKHIATGGQTTCAIKADGSVVCWGFGGDGQVGPGAPTTGSKDISIPVAVPNVSNAVSIAMSKEQSCTVLSDATVKCWGTDFNNQSSSAATAVAGLGNVATLTLGNKHACALKTDASVACWGKYNYVSAPAQQATPVAIVDASNAPLTNVLAVSSGLDHTCALKEDGSVFCWGLDDKGQLGDGLNVDRNTAAQVLAAGVGAAFTQAASQSIAIGSAHTCALKTNGEVMCWGANNEGQLGNGTSVSGQIGSALPLLANVSGVSAIAAGRNHTCALKTNGAVVCWGSANYGQLGDGSYSSSNNPVSTGLTGVSELRSGWDFSCALKSNGEVWCWGRGDEGQLGNGAFASSNVPVLVGITGVSSLSVGAHHACVLRTTGNVVCWGYGGSGRLGNGGNANSATPVIAGISAATALAGTCALEASGNVMCWGRGVEGQLGNGANANSFTPVSVNITGVSSLSSSGDHSCVLKSSGAVMCWGYGGYGQLGNGSNSSSNVPVIVNFASGITSLFAGFQTTCALKTDGGVMCWGYGGNGNLGNPAYTSSNVPVNVISITLQAAPVRTFWK